MRTILLAAAVTSALAAPLTAMAQAAPASPPAVPTLGQVLDASGISVSGYLDAAYSHANRNVEAGLPRVFDNQNNSFTLHQAGLTLAKQPKQGFGGLVNVIAGKDATVIHSFDTNSPNDQFDLTQGFVQYAAGPLTVIGGKFVTLAGTEVIASTGNTIFSRSLLFGAVPFTHTGLRATYAATDFLSLTAGLNNGWDQVKDTNRSKTLELGLTFTPIKPLTLVASGYYGKEETPTFSPAGTVGTSEGNRSAIDLVATWSVSDTLTLGGEYLRVRQKNFGQSAAAPAGAPGEASYSGTAGYVTYLFTPKWRGVARLEYFNDNGGLHFGTLNTKYKEATFDLAYLATDNVELRAEVRHDTANNAVPLFQDFSSVARKNLTTYALQAIYKF